MFYLLPTKRGLGVEFWGSYDDLRTIYEVLYSFWEVDFYEPNRESLISSICYEIRHAYQGDRLNRESSHFGHDPVAHYGFQISWVQLLFLIAYINHKKSSSSRNKLLDGIMLQIEYWTEKSLESFDIKTGKMLIPFVGNTLFGGNPYIYYYMRLVNADYFALGGGKNGFNQLPKLLASGVKGTELFKSIKRSLLKSAKEFQCDPLEIELDEDESIYLIEW
ncbi:DUF6904 family protein [Arthrospiribacter ruber]|uniref:Uncharacterized protein n=1 Tax=Arthrospiribacter ruber TaxID=2487934 RepID=A0A951IXV1_9BACT|nr:hypothetical protein [Arthrospiribacter ruber]MBW3467498.1 hypothetical protein [Arthrospiribacter ruber]